MSRRTDYSDAEWELLLGAGPAAAAALMLADRGGPLAQIQEAAALLVHFEQGRSQYPQNELIAALTNLRTRPGATVDRGHNLAPDVARTVTLDYCRRAAFVLAQKSTPQEAGEYKQWLLGVVQAVAQAAREGGVLHRDPNAVSATEQALLTEVAAALGVSAPGPAQGGTPQ